MNEHPKHPPAFLSRRPELLREHVIALRRLLLANDYQPTAVLTGQKRPTELDWQHKRGLPPFDARSASTGILTKGLRAFDVDIDDPEKVAIVAEVLERHFGPAPIRTRPGSPRFCALFRTAEDEPPPKYVIFLACGKIEVLGDGQQIMVDGEHPDGGAYTWEGLSPLTVPVEDLRAITEEQIAAVEDELLAVLGPEPAKTNGAAEREGGAGREGAEVAGETTLDDIIAALDALPADYPRDMRVKIGMAAYAGSGGAGIVFEAFRRWREGHGDKVPPGAIASAWKSFARARSVTVATLFGEVLNRIPDCRKPSAIAAAKAKAKAQAKGGGGGEPDDKDRKDPPPPPEPEPFDRETLIAAAKADPFSLYRPDALDALARLERVDLEGFARLLGELKTLKIGTTALRKAITARVREAGGGGRGGGGGRRGGGGGGGDSDDDAKKGRTTGITVAELNRTYCVVRDGGKTSVLSFEPHTWEVGPHRTYTRHVATFMTFKAFEDFYRDEAIKIGDTWIPIGEWWLNTGLKANPGKRKYNGLVFRPDAGAVVDGTLNLWHGFGVAEKPGDWSKMRQHIEVVLANNDTPLATYILNWTAWLFQHLALRAEVGLVFRGKIGTGKGTFVNALLRILGQHGIHISQKEHLAGRFNAHLRDACLIFADEAYWPGNKDAEGTLKRMISEKSLFIEGKGRDGVMVPNMLHVVMASNEDWVVPAGERERRYVVIDVPETKIQDHTWFKAIEEQMETGGYEGMLYDLRRRDLTGWHPRQLVQTTALLSQQERSLDFFDEWWLSVLENGVIPGSTAAAPDQSPPLEDFKASHETFHGPRTEQYDGLFTLARKSDRRGSHMTMHKFGRHLAKVGCTNTHRVMFRGAQRRSWKFPPLADARATWLERFPHWTWTKPDLTEWEPYDPT